MNEIKETTQEERNRRAYRATLVISSIAETTGAWIKRGFDVDEKTLRQIEKCESMAIEMTNDELVKFAVAYNNRIV